MAGNKNFYYKKPVNWPLLFRLLGEDEGLRFRPYRCTEGKLTVAVGHNLEANPIPGIGEGDSISKEYAIIIFALDMQRVLAEINIKFPWAWELSEIRFAVVADMLFALGLPRFLKFRKFIAAMARFDYETAKIELLDSIWARKLPNRSDRLARMLISGKWEEKRYG